MKRKGPPTNKYALIKRRNYKSRRTLNRTTRNKLNLRTGGLLSIETKFLDVGLNTAYSLTQSSDATSGEIQPDINCIGCLNAPQQGDTSSMRDGKQITMKSILLMGSIVIANQVNQGAGDSACTIFLALVMDTQTNGMTINSEDVYTNPSTNTNTMVVPFRNMSNTGRFKVLKTKTIVLPQAYFSYDGTNLEQAGYTRPFKMSYKWPMGQRVNFKTDSTTANVAGIIDNSVHLVGWVDKTGLAPTINFQSRLRFVG